MIVQLEMNDLDHLCILRVFFVLFVSVPSLLMGQIHLKLLVFFLILFILIKMVKSLIQFS